MHRYEKKREGGGGKEPEKNCENIEFVGFM